MITSNIVLPTAPASQSVVLPAAPSAVNLVLGVAYGPDFAPADFSAGFYISSIF